MRCVFASCVFCLLLSLWSCRNAQQPPDGAEKERAIIELDLHPAAQRTDSSELFYSEITCPKCEYKKVEKMPTEECRISYTCENCLVTLHPKAEDCCIFCSYGSIDCPSKQ